MTDRRNAIFISYASEDALEAGRLTAALREAGLEVWFDQSALKSGDAWDQMIRRQIRDCALVVAVISAHTNARVEGYFRREWKLAVDRTDDMADDATFLIPIVIDDTSQASARVPEKFRQMQWTRLPGGEPSRIFVERVRSLLEPAAPAIAERGRIADSGPAAVPATVSPHPHGALRWLWALPAVCLLGFLALRALRPTVSPATQPPVVAAVSPASIRSVAVLPFLDLSPQKDQGFFAEGMASEIIDRLAKIPKVQVTSRSAAFQFRQGADDSRSIGAKLKVAYLVEGSVVKIGGRIRVTSQLIESESGVHLWSDSEDREYGDVLKIQQQIATGIARALQLIVTAQDERRSRSLSHPEAYTEYLQGLHALDRFHQASLFEAQASFEHALALEPTFIEAAEALGNTHVAIAFDESMAPRLAWESARKAATAALRIDPIPPPRTRCWRSLPGSMTTTGPRRTGKSPSRPACSHAMPRR